jgi:hypothetical protein
MGDVGVSLGCVNGVGWYCPERGRTRTEPLSVHHGLRRTEPLFVRECVDDLEMLRGCEAGTP